MSVHNPEATFYVEDGFAAALIAESLPPSIRRRVDVVPIGGAAQVAAQLGAHFRGGNRGPAKCVFDGDCSKTDIRRWLRREDIDEREMETSYIMLPANEAPEV